MGPLKGKTGNKQNINCSMVFSDPPPRVMKIKWTSGTYLNLKAFAQQRKPEQA